MPVDLGVCGFAQVKNSAISIYLTHTAGGRRSDHPHSLEARSCVRGPHHGQAVDGAIAIEEDCHQVTLRLRIPVLNMYS